MKRAHHEIGSHPDPAAPQLNRNPAESPKVPKISRKVHACTECQGRKIKCDLAPGRSICGICQRKGLRCVVNKSLQSLLEDEVGWKSTMEQTSQRLQAAVSEILHTLDLPALESFPLGRAEVFINSNPSTNVAAEVGVGFFDQQSLTRSTDVQQENKPARMAMTRENSQELESPNEIGNALVAAPMGTLYEVTKLRNLRSNPHGHIYPPKTTLLSEDFISKGKISETEAQELFSIFSTSLNHFLWGGIALVHADLASVRNSSSLLLAAILTVTALHIPGKTHTFDICYSEFLSLVCDSMLDRYHTLDGVRGLCIGAFWLSDVSWKLSGHAVRIATELNLHQSYSRAIKGSTEHLEGTRLWYFLYVCDHHFSIAYGRPPVIHDDPAIAGRERFLQLPGITQADLRLHSQVAIFVILTEMYNTFGPDIEHYLTDDDLTKLRHFNVSLDNWRTKWERPLVPNPYIGNYPSKGVGLHYNFAKLQLNSLSLRRCQQPSSHALSAGRREFANIAISCAMTILRMVLEEPDIRSAVVGIPLYLHTMISYAAVFLLKVHLKWKSSQLGTDSILISGLIGQVIELLNQARASERHLTYHIASGLSKMLDKFMQWELREGQALAQDFQNQGEVPQAGAVAAFPGSGSSGALSRDYGPPRFYGEPLMELLDEHYFPIGIFDVFSSYIPEQR